jgi:hypothetical protein
VNHETVQAEYVNVGRSGKVGYFKTLGLREGNTRKIVSFREKYEENIVLQGIASFVFR